MIGLSTAWFPETSLDVEEWLKGMEALGVSCLELEYRIRESFFRRLRPKLKEKGYEVLSVHNFLPFPDDYDHLKPSGDLFLLSSLDREEQQKAVTYTVKTIQTAHDLGCSAVVLHLGKVEMDSYFSTFCGFYDDQKVGSPEMNEFLALAQAERTKKQRRFLDAVCFSLDKLAREADRRSVRLGVENRYYFHEIPSCDELGIIFDRFAGAPVFHWHDAGHGFVQEQLGIQFHKEWLEKYGEKLLGVHLHDANGYNDHQAPGTGKINLDWIKEYVSNETVKILEIHPQVGIEEARKGFARLKELGY